jgi:hypothetical protein
VHNNNYFLDLRDRKRLGLVRKENSIIALYGMPGRAMHVPTAFISCWRPIPMCCNLQPIAKTDHLGRPFRSAECAGKLARMDGDQDRNKKPGMSQGTKFIPSA